MRRRRRIYLLLVVGAAGVGLVLALLALFASLDRFGPGDYAQIHLGMSREEVEAILGKLDGDRCRYEGTNREEVVASRWSFQEADGESDPEDLRRERAGVWMGPRYLLWVLLDERGTVRRKELWALKPPSLWWQIKRAFRLDSL